MFARQWAGMGVCWCLCACCGITRTHCICVHVSMARGRICICTCLHALVKDHCSGRHTCAWARACAITQPESQMYASVCLLDPLSYTWKPASLATIERSSTHDNWHMCTGALTWQDFFNIHVHAPPDFVYPAHSLFAGRIIEERVAVGWGQYSVVSSVQF